MENRIDEILEGYSIFFNAGRFNLKTLHKEFSNSEYYSSQSNIRSYDLNDSANVVLKPGDNPIQDETFEEYMHNQIRLSNQLFKDTLLNYLKTIKSDKQQNAVLFSLLGDLQNYLNILASTEDPTCKHLMVNIEESRDFIIKIFSPQLGLTSDEKISDRRNSLSTYFRGIEKLEFDLKKKEIATLFILLVDSKILKYPVWVTDLAKFLDNNVKYRNANENVYVDMKDSISTISKIKAEGYDAVSFCNEILEKWVKSPK